MNTTDTANIICPYCGEKIVIIVDCSIPRQVYIEDCEVCCRPITLEIGIVENNEITVTARQENECG